MLIWLVILGWQVIDHHRFKDNARTALLNRARDITNSLATVIRSMRRFGGGELQKPVGTGAPGPQPPRRLAFHRLAQRLGGSGDLRRGDHAD